MGTHSKQRLEVGTVVLVPRDLIESLGLSSPSSTGDSVRAVVFSEAITNGSVELALMSGEGVPSLQQRLWVGVEKVQVTDEKALGDLVEKALREATKSAARAHYQVKHAPSNRPFALGDRVSYGGRVFDHREVENLVDSALDFWLTAGRFSEEFERTFAKILGVKHSILVNSGSSANLVSFMSLTSPKLGDERIRKGDEVISVAAGFPATITPIIQFGAVPVFLDVTLPTYNIDVSQLEEALSSRTRAVMIAHTLGNPFDVKAVKEFCEKHDLWLIEDNCDSLGSEYVLNGEARLTGTFGDFGTSSFYPPHHLTMGEGGAVYTNSSKLDRIAASFRDWGRDCWCPSGKDDTCGKRFAWELGSLPCGYDHKYTYSHLGYNLKATDMQASIGVAQLEKLAQFTAARRKNWAMIREGLRDLEDYFILPEATAGANPSWFGFLLTVRDDTPGARDRLVRHLEKNGVQTRMLFAGNFLRHPCCDDLREQPGSHRVIGDLRNTDSILNKTFWVGVYPGLREGAIDYMVSTIRDGVSANKNQSRVSLQVSSQ